MSNPWILYACDSRDGAMNMALDEAIMRRFRDEYRGRYDGALRFYLFDRPTVTMGCFQPYDAVRTEVGHEVDVVRRMTAGGVVDHDSSLTMTIVTYPEVHPSFSSVDECYKMVHVSVCKALRRCELECYMHVDKGQKKSRREMVQRCFVEPVMYDLMSGGEKVVGGAQKRSRGVIVHQGSICLRRPEWQRGSHVRDLVRIMVAKTFEEDFDVCFERMDSDSVLLAQAQEICRAKYAHKAWRMKYV